MASVGLTRRVIQHGLFIIAFLSFVIFYNEILSFFASTPITNFSMPHLTAGTSFADEGPFDGSTTGHDLRIMPMGASITTGFGSTDGNGYRQHLQDYLEGDDNTVHFVGSEHNGNMTENHFEAWSGRVISQLFDPARESIPLYKPNVVLILLGNNDCKWHLEDKAAERMGNLTRLIVGLDRDIAVLVAQLPPNTVDWVDKNIRDFNQDVVPILKGIREEGYKVGWVDTHTPLSRKDDMDDDTHPNDRGFEKIGKAFYEGVRDVMRREWISEPKPVGAPEYVEAELKRHYLRGADWIVTKRT